MAPPLAEAASDAGAPGPWVLVIGMHRSGTSALTGLLAGLGFALPPPGDLIEGRPDNPVHFESQALIEVNDDLLHAFHGSWQAPPVLDGAWEDTPTARAFDQRSREVLAATYKAPGGRSGKTLASACFSPIGLVCSPHLPLPSSFGAIRAR